MVQSAVIDQRLRQETAVEPQFSALYDFAFDPFQCEALEHIKEGRSVMVAAPTSSGKTLVAEYGLWRALRLGSKAVYTAPIKALSNQKRRDLEILFPGRVGLLTGDRSEDPDAPIVVMTTEVLRNMLIEDADLLRTVSCVVFDEVHYLADPDRGTVWEESIIACPKHVQLICLSATIANAEEIAAWIAETHRPIALVRHDDRPVPLEHFYYTRGKLHLVQDDRGERRAMFPREGRVPSPHPADVLAALARSNLLPAIWFAFSRAGVEEAAQDCVISAPRRSKRQLETIEGAMAWTIDSLPKEDRDLPQLAMLMQLLPQGIGFHHAGLLPPLKELVERLFTQGLLSMVCATDTLAVGINMPARTVVISTLSRPFGGMLTANDFSQLTGRAGRRGIDEWGAVVMLPARYYTFEQAYREVSGPLDPIRSAFRLRYSTLLSAIEEGSDERLARLIRASLRQYQMKAAARRAQAHLADLSTQLDPTDQVDDEGTLDYLALQASLSVMEKEQKRAKNARSKARGGSHAARRLEKARQERDRLSSLLHTHPLHSQAVELEREDPNRLALLRRINKLRAVIDEANRESTRDAAETANAVRTVLSRLRYLDKQGRLARKARGLREIVAPSGIVLCELHEQGAFHHLDSASIAEVISWFAADAERRRYNMYRLSGLLAERRQRALRTFQKIALLEEAEGIELAQGPSSWFYGVANAWCAGDSIGDITARIQLGEGDVVSMLNKTVDLLDQFESMLRQCEDFELVGVTTAARRLLVRGLVAMVRSSTAYA